jgi:hypothetical protein
MSSSSSSSSAPPVAPFASSSAASSSAAAPPVAAAALAPGAHWGLPGIVDVSIEVQDEHGAWVDTALNPPIVSKGRFGFRNHVQRNIEIKALGNVVTLVRFRQHIYRL